MSLFSFKIQHMQNTHNKINDGISMTLTDIKITEIQIKKPHDILTLYKEMLLAFYEALMP